MSVADDASVRRAIARTLTVAVRATLAVDAPAAAYEAARDAAQVLGLAGLDRAIRACAEHAGRTRPADVVALVDRLRRLTEESDLGGDLDVFERLDAELVALSEELAAYEWDVSAGPEDDDSAAVPTMTVAQVLEDVTMTGDDSRRMATRLRLTATVAATLRASLDWLMPAGARSVRIHGEPSLVELKLDAVTPTGLGPAHRVLSAVGGNLGPAIEPEGPEGGWIIRVPSFAARPTYLMVMQGGIPLALPWHSVLRLRMAGAADARGDMRGLEYPTLEFFAPPVSAASEYPLVLVGHGLKRAWLVADRLIWRLMADPCESPGSAPASGLAETVRTDEGEVFWRAEPGRLLRRVDVPVTPPQRGASQEPHAETPPPSTLGENDVEPADAPASAEELEVEAHPVLETVPADGGTPPESESVPSSAPALTVPAAQATQSAGSASPALASTVPASPALTSAESASPALASTVPASPAPTSAGSASPALASTMPASPASASTASASSPSTATPSLPPVASVSTPPPSPAIAPGTPSAMSPSASRPASPIGSRVERRPRALVAEDSLTARIFLSRLLDQQGFVTESVPSAAQLLERLAEGPWSVVMVDVDLPDDRGAAWLQLVREAAPGSALVALVRDAAEGDSARRAGVSETLEKPFERTSLVALLARLGFAKTGS